MFGRIAVFGLGYVGLTTALALDAGEMRVVGYDIDRDKLDKLKRGELYIYEPCLEDLIKKHNILVTDDLNIALQDDVKIALVCVGTPPYDDGSINLEYVFNCMKDIATNLDNRDEWLLIILKSTVIPGTSEKCIALLEHSSGKRHGHDFGFVMSPEFLREGSALSDTVNPDKIVIGFKYESEWDMAAEFYEQMLLGHNKEPDYDIFVDCNYVNAEFIKYTNNAYLATKISFMNDMASLCEEVPGADIKVIEKALGMDYRISPHFLKAGLGYGGSCFPKDVRALVRFSEDVGADLMLLPDVRGINMAQRDWPEYIIRHVYREEIGYDEEGVLQNFSDLRIGVLGLAFKPNTDDMRNAPSIEIIRNLDIRGADIIVHDPEAGEAVREVLPTVTYADDVYAVLDGADCVIVVTDWKEYTYITPATFKKLMRRPVVIDGRRIYDPEKMIKAGIEYYGVGYGKTDATY